MIFYSFVLLTIVILFDKYFGFTDNAKPEKPPADTMPETNDNLTTLRRSNVFMKDPDNVIRMIEKIRKDGANKLQIVSDFDLTITKQHVNGTHVLTSFGIFWKCKQIPPETVRAAKNLYNKYHPIEIDPELDLKAKINAMENWMIETRDLLKNIDFDRSELEQVAKNYGTDVRDGTKELFDRLHGADIPILVFSAGLGDVVEHVLRNHNVLLKNVKIVSNFLKYKENQLDGFKNPTMIHVFNKNEHAVDQEYFKVLEGRSNVIVMGDIIGDSDMANGVEDAETVLKIGFLYGNVEQRLPSYLEAFDIVLVDDQTMDVANDILNKML